MIGKSYDPFFEILKEYKSNLMQFNIYALNLSNFSFLEISNDIFVNGQYSLYILLFPLP